MDQINSNQEKVATSIFHDAQGQLTLRSGLSKFQTHPSSYVCYHYLITCKYEKDLIKNSWEKLSGNTVFPIMSMGIFSNAQGQLTLHSVAGSGQILNSFELSCMSSWPVNMKWITWKKQLRKSGNIYILDAQGQETLWSGIRSGRISNSYKLLCM